MKRLLALCALTAAVLTVPAVADAATVSRFTGTDGAGTPYDYLFFDAAPGEDNDLLLTEPTPGTFVFQDAVPVGSSDCQQGSPSNPASATAVTCQTGALTGLLIRAVDGLNHVRVYGDQPVTISGVNAVENHLNGGDGNDSILGDDGSDVLFGGKGNDSVSAGLGADDVRGGLGNDSLEGGGGNDTLTGGSGADTESGGAGDDTSAYGSRLDPVHVSLDDLTGDGQAGEQDNVKADVENIVGGAGADQLIAQDGAVGNDLYGGLGDDLLGGGGGNDTTLAGGPGNDDLYGQDGADGLYGGPGEDDLSAGAGSDLLHGEDADDVLQGGAGADSMFGGAGVDTVSYGPEVFVITADLDGASGDDGAAGEGDTVKADVENLIGGFASDLLAGNDGPNLIHGGPGNDDIDGRGGSDQLFGGDDIDTLRSLDGVGDSVDCGAGSDSFQADGADALSGCETNLSPPAEPPAPGDPTQPVDPARPVEPTATLGPLVGIGPARLRLTARGQARLRVTCPASAREGCLGALRLTRRMAGRRRTIATQRFAIDAGRTQRLTVRLARRTAAGLPATGIRVRAVAAARDSVSTTRTTYRAVRILRPRATEGGTR